MGGLQAGASGGVDKVSWPLLGGSLRKRGKRRPVVAVPSFPEVKRYHELENMICRRTTTRGCAAASRASGAITTDQIEQPDFASSLPRSNTREGCLAIMNSRCRRSGKVRTHNSVMSLSHVYRSEGTHQQPCDREFQTAPTLTSGV